MKLERYIKEFKHNPNTAFEPIYHQTKHAVFAMAVSIVRDHGLAEDVMQETYMKMVDKHEDYNPSKPFINWLLTITKNTALDLLRKRKNETSVDINEYEHLLSSKDSPIETKLEAEYYLSLLEEDEMTIVLLKTVAELKFKTIAELLEKPAGTVSWMYYESIKKMQQAERVMVHEKKSY